jgi:opacity protein-like surface antigen
VSREYWLSLDTVRRVQLIDWEEYAMVRKALRTTPLLLLLAVSVPAFAQYVATPQPEQTTAAPSATADNLTITAKNGQTQEQQWSDRYECHRWARNQSGFDPAQPASDLTPSESASRRDQYRRAFTACLEGRGYSVRYAAPAAPAPTMPSRQPVSAKRYASAEPEVRYRPLSVHIDGGYSVTTGMTDRYLEDGSNVGFGITWFPTSVLPIGLRVDGSYSSFRAKDALLDLYGSNFTHGYQDIYGGDADLQLDLAHQSSSSKLYVFGGAGWYRVQTRVRQLSFEQGTICGFYFCESGLVPVATDTRTTSSWHSSWNAGLGWEVALAEGASFFVEARYLQITPRSSKMQFVPIRVGLRF